MQNRTDTPARALWQAAAAGDRVMVARLLAEGVDVNVWDPHGRSALTFAALAGHIDLASDLLAAGAWVDPHDDYCVYLSPLMAAASEGHLRMVVLLLEAGANPCLFGGVSLATAQHYAGNWGGRDDIAELLVKAEDAWRASHR